MIDQLDDAIRSALADIVAATPEATDQPLADLPVGIDARSRRTPVMVGSLALAAAASLALVVIATRDDSSPDRTAAGGPSTSAPLLPVSTPPEGTPVELWPVQLVPGLTPWYQADDAVVAALGPVQSGPAQNTVWCTEWTAADGVVDCTELTGEGYLPMVGYSQGERYVVMSTLHSDIGVEAYANNYSHGKDVGYDEPLLPLEDVTIGSWPGKLVVAPNGVIRVTALGAVRDGNVCLLTDVGCAPLAPG